MAEREARLGAARTALEALAEEDDEGARLARVESVWVLVVRALSGQRMPKTAAGASRLLGEGVEVNDSLPLVERSRTRES